MSILRYGPLTRLRTTALVALAAFLAGGLLVSQAQAHVRKRAAARHARVHRHRSVRRARVHSHQTATRSDHAVTKAAATFVGDQKRVCVYDVNTISGLSSFASLTGRQTVDCALVYTGSPDWAGWVNPWFLHHPDPDLDWAGWVRASPANDRRQLIISQPLIPGAVANSAWRSAGAAGAFTGYARQFAQNLVADGVGDAIIRLSWEANGTWGYQNIGSSAQDMSQWVAFWRNTVLAMRSVPGAHFRFDWTINNGYRAIPFADYYPGNDVVDIIGADVYDQGVGAGLNRWATVYGQPGGLQSLVAFARANNKPISIPEWGVGPAGSSNLGGGDDPSFIDGLAGVIRTNNVAYQSYFFAHGWATELQGGPLSLASYRAHFGSQGDSVGTDGGTAIQSASAHSGAPKHLG